MYQTFQSSQVCECTADTAENYRKMTHTVPYATPGFTVTVWVMVRLASYTAVFVRPYADTVRRAALARYGFESMVRLAIGGLAQCGFVSERCAGAVVETVLQRGDGRPLRRVFLLLD